MRKTRIIAILCLSLILCFLCVSTNTFSWFTRPQEGKGKSFIWSGNSYNQTSSKKFNVTTYEMTNEDGVYGKDSISEIKGKIIPAGKRVCYKTEIKNTGKLNAQTVSLYLSGVESSNYGNTYVGVNNPMKTYKALAPESKTKNENGMKNVYVGIRGYDGYNPNNFKLHYWNSGDKVVGDADIKYLHSTSYKRDNDTLDVYHVEVPYDAIGVKVRQNGDWKGNDIDISTNNFVCLYLDSSNDYDNAYSISTNEKPAAIKSFYSEASINVNGKIDLTASGNDELEYKSDNPGIAEIETDPDSKVVYVKGVSEGVAKISVTSTGTVCDNQGVRKPDTQTFTCEVHVKSVPDKLTDVPVVTNMVTYPYNKTSKENLVTVYWYIKNEGSSDITVSVDKINVTL